MSSVSTGNQPALLPELPCRQLEACHAPWAYRFLPVLTSIIRSFGAAYVSCTDSQGRVQRVLPCSITPSASAAAAHCSLSTLHVCAYAWPHVRLTSVCSTACQSIPRRTVVHTLARAFRGGCRPPRLSQPQLAVTTVAEVYDAEHNMQHAR